jgi:hypothetical protein
MAFTSFEELSKLSDDVLATEILEAKKAII